MTSVTFTPDVGGDNVTIDDSDSATTGLGNGGHRTRFMIALAQFMKVVLWVKTTAALVLGYRDAAATSASQAQTFAGAAQAAAGIPSFAAKGNYVFTVNPGATGVAWSNALTLAALMADALGGKTATLTHTQPLIRYVESDQAGAVGVFQTQVEGGSFALLRNTAAARDFSTNVAEHLVNSAGRHLFGGAADDALYKYIFEGNLRCIGTLSATVNVAWTSDGRLKDDVTPIDGALAKVERMEGVSYVRNDIDCSRRFVGVIAQDMLEIVPEAVQEGAGGYLAVDYGALSPVLIEAIKELAGRVRQLEGARV
ncbi:tail fiber domain-containing protein [Cupriavidus basilensis]|uniref:tail fiber domain-containing protein n=1 Tax=Cupriavidus basilensis TaxID=68895 RepID=UPI00284CB84A|nr:tail fiber domain-containing protein [Cupriavidus basilensis]MDR3382317.1 tail fiber domain-containing protein [Cupriavidus basilensis]